MGSGTCYHLKIISLVFGSDRALRVWKIPHPMPGLVIAAGILM